MKHNSIRTLILCDYPISDRSCFNYLPEHMKLDRMGSRFTEMNPKITRLAIEYLRLYTLVFFYSHKWDVIISTSFMHGFGLCVLQMLGLRKKSKHIVVDQAAFGINAALRVFLPIIMRRTSRIVCFTTKQRDWWNNKLGSDKAVFVPYAIMDDKKTSLTTEEDYIFSGGASSRDYATLVKAVKNTKIRTVIVAPKDPITRKTSLEGVSLPSNVTFHPGLPYDQFMQLLRSSKIVIIPLKDISHAGGQSVLLEAFSAGKPTIVTKTTGMMDYVEHGKTGILVSPNNPEELRLAISCLLENEKLRKHLGYNARKAFENKYSIQEMGKTFSKIIEEVLPEK